MKKLLTVLGSAMLTTSTLGASLNTVSCGENYTLADFQKLLSEIENLEENKYTEESLQNLMIVMIETSTNVILGKSVTKNYKKLKNAMNALVLK
ncbi:hypothetical protein [Spiroplasma floricola]|uniref:Uncharacterized protein n=1 Tax=Spiroplasma floricola 23-6 TaxID=1336749 RepID=A0A2K8SDK6_9MOLU|nr:hypothetical protein [Spiroplasma floricola]AUB31539.1 hypothetical protein SFLOR_v1c04870 [Spiroplasma floricola 23-6]